ncbi:hypothetical protein BHE90_009965 [Fusarium euwallaceae]|uniref:Uncharacterized protein n=1 Tax=Fusarium euwallaceae TaxID=1147111 RepID=A0A430LIR5_9HYPO|nr:hypothetical protein BHE90_009965 [Fusarium euwallaceae]
MEDAAMNLAFGRIGPAGVGRTAALDASAARLSLEPTLDTSLISSGWLSVTGRLGELAATKDLPRWHTSILGSGYRLNHVLMTFQWALRCHTE